MRLRDVELASQLKTVDSKVEEICVTNDLLNIAETIITEGEKVENETFDNINLS